MKAAAISLTPQAKIYLYGKLRGQKALLKNFRPRFLLQEINELTAITTSGLLIMNDQDFLRWQDELTKSFFADQRALRLWVALEDHGNLPPAFLENAAPALGHQFGQYCFTFYPGQLAAVAQQAAALLQRWQERPWKTALAQAQEQWWPQALALLPLRPPYFADLEQYLQFNEELIMNFDPQHWWAQLNIVGQQRHWWHDLKWGKAEDLLYYCPSSASSSSSSSSSTWAIRWDEDNFLLVAAVQGLGPLSLALAAARWPKKTRPKRELDGEDALQNIPLPVAVFEEQGNLCMHNNAFAQLQLSGAECWKLTNGQELECCGRIYKLWQQTFILQESSYRLFVFQDWHPHFAEIKNINPSELGIISGSIAHELNNPLAGISAAIEVLKLTPWPPETQTALEEMQRSTQRCRQLVDIFLGFSKARAPEQLGGTLGQAYQEALNLLRFRMVEANTFLDFSYQEAAPTMRGHVINLPLATMIFYLILHKLLTAWSHLVLINAASGHAINGQLWETPTAMHLTLVQAVPFAQAVQDSKLINYLVSMANLKLEISEKSLCLAEQITTTPDAPLDIRSPLPPREDFSISP